MKSMKTKLILVCLLLAFLPIATHARTQAPMDFLQHENWVEVVVQCMDYALVRMGTMPGIELSSQICLVSGRGHAVRMVQNRQLNETLRLLAGLGEIVHSQSHAWNLFSNFAGLTAEFSVRNREYERLMELLYEAETMREFNQIEARLQLVIGTLESIRGQMNHLEQHMGSAQISITLVQYVPEIIPDEDEDEDEEPEEDEEDEYIVYVEPGRWQQIADAFLSSANGTFEAVQAILLLLARVSLQLVAAVFIGIIVARIVISKRQKVEVE